jgi:hypothetical protein
MSISFACVCGKNFTVAAQYAGKRAKCPACSSALIVPAPIAKPEPEPAPAEIDEDAAYRALLDVPEAEPRAPDRSAFPAYDIATTPRQPAPTAAIPVRSKPKLLKPSNEERKARKTRLPRQPDPDRTRKILYIIGGILMVLFGGAIGFFSINEGISIRGGVFGFFMVIGGIGTFFQGITGEFDDD